MRACLPDRDGYVDCDGAKVFYEVFGEGHEPTIVLVNGWQIAHSQLWKAQVPYLARHYRVVTFDGLGNGGSDRPDDLARYHPLASGPVLQSVLDATCPTPPILVGVSGGAGMSLVHAATAPESVAGAVLINAAWLRRADLEAGAEPPPIAALIEEVASLRDNDDDEAWDAFAERFYRAIFPEPHSTKQIEDGVNWSRTAYRPGLIEAMPGTSDLSLFETFADMMAALAPTVACPVLIIHGSDDLGSTPDAARHFAELMGADLVVVEGGGHCPQNRDPVLVNRVIRTFVDHVHPPRRVRTWPRALTRPKRALFLCSPIGLGHARRDVAIARALREERPGLTIDWLAQHPVTTFLEAAGEHVHPASRALVSESAHWESECGEHDLHAFQALRRMDETLVANFMVFDDVVDADLYDLVIADEAWDVDHLLFENPELKRFAYAWLTDFVGFLPMVDGDAWLTADYNAEMVEQVARYPRLRDRALFLGDPEDIVADALGPGLPGIAEWTAEHFSFPGYVTGFDPEDRDTLRAELGYRADETVCIVSVGGSGVGIDLLRKAIAAHRLAAASIPSLRTIVVCGPRIDPASLDLPTGVEARAFVPDLHRHLQACDVAIVQGGLTTCMELAAAGRPFLYFPLANHFEQQRHVPHRLNRYRAGRRMSYADATPEDIAGALADALRQPIDYLPVSSAGAVTAARSLAELI